MRRLIGSCLTGQGWRWRRAGDRRRSRRRCRDRSWSRSNRRGHDGRGGCNRGRRGGGGGFGGGRRDDDSRNRRDDLNRRRWWCRGDTGRFGRSVCALDLGAAVDLLLRLLGACGLDHALTCGPLIGGEAVIRCRRALSLGRRWPRGLEHPTLGVGWRGKVAAAGTVRARAFGLHDHRFGPTVAEALLHRARTDRSTGARLQGQGLASAWRGVAVVVVLVAHSLALLTDQAVPAIHVTS